LLDIIAITHPVVPENVTVVPELLDNCGRGHSSSLFEMLFKSSANADDRQAHNFLGFLIIPNYDTFSYVHSYGRSRFSKADIESVRLSVIFPIQRSLFLVEELYGFHTVVLLSEGLLVK
jgi:hypothetical protein